MAITVDWGTKIISVPKADLTLIQPSPEIRELDIDVFRLALRALEDDIEGIPYQITHNHNTTVDIAGLTLARVIELINGYTVTFEDGQYAVNLVGANSNIAENTNVNQVSIRSFNSAGLVDMGTVASDITQIQVDVADIDGNIVTITGDIATINSNISTIQSDVTNIESAMAILEDYTMNKMSIDTTSRSPQVWFQIWDDAGTSVVYEHRLLTTSGSDPTVDPEGISDRGDQVVL